MTAAAKLAAFAVAMVAIFALSFGAGTRFDVADPMPADMEHTP